jgi:AraC-like DNA-binding protein
MTMASVSTSVTAHESTYLAGIHGLASSLAKLLETAKNEFEKDRAAAKASIVMASSLLQVEIDRRASAPDRNTSSWGLAGWQIHRVRQFIDNHLDETIHVSHLSEIARRSTAHFSRAFKRSFGKSPHAYLVERRLERASHLMLSSDAPLSEIAVACGFTDQAHLSNLFRQKTGQSPSAWRRERRDREILCSINGADNRELKQMT